MLFTLIGDWARSGWCKKHAPVGEGDLIWFPILMARFPRL